MTSGPAEASRGFSLIELLVVIAITSVLAIGATLILPGRDGSTRQAAAIEERAAELRWNAMLSGRAFAMRPADGGLQLEQSELAGSWKTLETAKEGRSEGMRVIFHEDGRVSGGPIRLGRELTCRPDVARGLRCARDG